MCYIPGVGRYNAWNDHRKDQGGGLEAWALFLKMIQGEATDEEIDQLEEASALKDIAHMPARVKCAVLGWHTLEESVKEYIIRVDSL